MAISSLRSIAIFLCGLIVGWSPLSGDCGGQAGSILFAQQPAKPPSQPNQGQLLLRRARAGLARHKTISAKMHERVRLYGQELVVSGIFAQGPPDLNLMKLDLSVKVAGQATYVQQRCDGRFFWEQKLFEGVPRLTRIDVRRVLAARRAAANRPTANSSAPELPSLGLGGAAFLLDQLDAWCLLQRWGESKLTGPEELPVYVLEASWRPEQLVAWLPEQRASVDKGQPLNLDKLPPAFPDRILISLGRDDLFPRRIEYGASSSRRFDNDDAPLVQVYFEDVRFDEPIEAEMFGFQVGVTPPLDGTDAYLLRHGLLAPPTSR